jgi:hypothetical protein
MTVESSFSPEWSVEREVHPLPPKGEQAIRGEMAGTLSGVMPTVPLRRSPQ